ncbi:variant leucine-rich repeat-containing protein [Kitasatospora cineracea]|uniref:variant leucine-rich repeat-containing protein n=1 Tax=Kitasatospora cineracea TaxID=88074 RepID=UPI00378F27D8
MEEQQPSTSASTTGCGRSTGPGLRNDLQNDLRNGRWDDPWDDLMDQLLDDPSEEVRRAATLRTRDTAALWRAAEDVPAVRAAAAANPHAPADLLAELADDHDGDVRAAVVRNPACPPGLRRRVAAAHAQAPSPCTCTPKH